MAQCTAALIATSDSQVAVYSLTRCIRSSLPSGASVRAIHYRMASAYFRQLVDRLSVKAIFNRLDKTKLQHELDTHRLYLVTSHFDRLSAGEHFANSYVQDVAAEAQKLGHEGMKSAVAAALQKQFMSASTALHDCLVQASDPRPAAMHAIWADLRQKEQAAALAAPKTRRPRGLAAAMGASDSRSNLPAVPSTQENGSSQSSSSSSDTSASTSPEAITSSNSNVRPHDSSTAPNSSSSSNSSSSMSSNKSGDNKADVSSSTSRRVPSHSKAGSRGSAAALTMAELSSALQKRIGYTLEVRPSGISHPDAGDGLWLQGTAPVGAIIGLYPGLVYEPMHYRRIPGYPKIDRHNDYFLARFDGALIDGLSWGRGQTTLGRGTDHAEAHLHNTHHAMLTQLRQKEMRHPLALAHYANHPAAGDRPNVMVAAFDFIPQQGDLSWVSAYMPNVMYHDIGAGAVHPSDRIKGLAFVATRQIRDEEVLLNYRLNPQVQKPAWYAPVDVAEDKRRWY